MLEMLDEKQVEQVMKKVKTVVLKHSLSPGDVVVMTAAVESLKQCHPNLEIIVQTTCNSVWENNPHVTVIDIADDPPEEAIVIQMKYDMINTSSQISSMFIQGFVDHISKNFVPIELKTNRPHLYLNDEEKGWINQIQEHHTQKDVPYWIVCSGTKTDFTAKRWGVENYQKVVDHFRGRIQFVQIGEKDHLHDPLTGVISLVGDTDLRQLIRLAYSCQGGLGPITLLQHLCAAFEKPYFALVGGREGTNWVSSYPKQTTFTSLGSLPCCKDNACWKSRVIAGEIGDGDKKDIEALCEYPILGLKRPIPKCLAMIRPEEVCYAIERYLGA